MKKLPLNDVSGTLEVASELFPGEKKLKSWRDHEVCPFQPFLTVDIHWKCEIE